MPELSQPQLVAFLNVLFWVCFHLETWRHVVTGVPPSLRDAFEEQWGR